MSNKSLTRAGDTPPQDSSPTQHSALSTQHFFLLLICAAYLVVAALFAVFTPAWQSPDEPAHYNTVAQVAERGCCPVIEIGDWKLAYLSQLTSQRFAPDLLDDLGTLQYEDHQPPLYYLLASVVFNLTNGSLIGLRLFSALIGLGVILSTVAIGRVMYPERPWVGLGAAAFVAFLPQHVAILASVNNDGLAEAVIGVTLLVAVRYLKGIDASTKPRLSSPVLLGILVGIGFLTKASTLFLAAVVPLAIVLKWWGERGGVGEVWARRASPIRDLFTQLTLFFVPALLLGSIWWARNLGVYGWPDFLGLRRHDVVVADQPRTADFIADNGWQAYLNRAFGETFNSFWGQFGWMALPMPSWIYRIFEILLLVVVGGWVVDVVEMRRKPARTPLPGPHFSQGTFVPVRVAVHGEGEAADAQPASPKDQQGSNRASWVILTLTAVLALLAFVYYNTEFLQHQGRYLFPALIPFALWMALGVDAWQRVLGNNGRGDLAGRPYTRWFTAALFLPMALLDVYLLWRVIVPGLSP